QMESEQESFSRELHAIDLDKLPPNYHNQSDTESKTGNATIRTHQDIHKTTDEKTGTIIISEQIITSVNGEVSDHECIVDEDCEKEHFCLVSLLESKCLKSGTQDESCTRDAECRSEHLCVWGHCRRNASKGENGTICEQQLDCSNNMCCAFQTDLLFPVCSPLPTEHQLCHNPLQNLLDIITWEFEPEGALDHCPCAKGLICQPQRPGSLSVCKQSSVFDDHTTSPGDRRLEDQTFLDMVSKEGAEGEDSYRDIIEDFEEAVARGVEEDLFYKISDEPEEDRTESLTERELMVEPRRRGLK
uniref:Dickkopf-related protein 3 n=1 Tax=Callorhinchus milii TaxID=7868 RepID=A0A4W3GYK2_CALMI